MFAVSINKCFFIHQSSVQMLVLMGADFLTTIQCPGHAMHHMHQDVSCKKNPAWNLVSLEF